MEFISLIDFAKEHIEAKIIKVKKKYELIYSTAKDQAKKDSFMKTIQEIDRDLIKLTNNTITETDLKKYEITAEDLEKYLSDLQKPKAGNHKILRNIIIEKLNKLSVNEEINSIWSYLNFFGREYLGLLSEQNLRLDFGHSFTRDDFFTLYNKTIRTMEDYGQILEQLQTAALTKNNEYRERLIIAQNKGYRDIVLKTGRFLNAIHTFIDDIAATEKRGERVLLEPDKVIEIKGETSNIDGLTAREALMDLYQFVGEFIDFLKIPDLKKISEEDEKLL
jgi:hypothetical protein